MIKSMINRLLGRQEFRFLMVGGINTAVGYGTYALFVFLGFDYLVAFTIATIVGVINSYLWNRFFTFRSSSKALSEISRFALVYLVSFCVGLLFLKVIVGWSGINQYLAGILNIMMTTAISWFGHKNFSFRAKENK
ncbi:MAG: GtrA family protein [Candidatus Saccharibacteria bacterium]